LIQNESNIIQLEEDIIALKDLLQIAVTELSNEVDVTEAVDVLGLGNDDFNHSNDVRVFAVFEQDDLSQYTSCLGE
jgi:hypothetical protein